MLKLDALKSHYERFPYPQAPIFAKARPDRIALLNYRAGIAACFGSTIVAKEKPRILVAGCGTVEPIAIALANPKAEIVAIDLSEASIRSLKRKLFLHRLTKRVGAMQGDLLALPSMLGNFDYIVATGVLHHLPDPSVGLHALEQRLAPGGIVRLMLYSTQGREWIERLRDWRITLNIKSRKELESALAALPATHPFRITYALHSDVKSESGLRDAFFHVQEKSFDALEMAAFLGSAGLEARRFLHRTGGQPNSILPHGAQLSDWEKIAVLDRLHALEENFVFFATRKLEPFQQSTADFEWNEAVAKLLGKKVWSHLLEKEVLLSRRAIPKEVEELESALYLLRAGGST